MQRDRSRRRVLQPHGRGEQAPPASGGRARFGPHPDGLERLGAGGRDRGGRPGGGPAGLRRPLQDLRRFQAGEDRPGRGVPAGVRVPGLSGVPGGYGLSGGP